MTHLFQQNSHAQSAAGAAAASSSSCPDLRVDLHTVHIALVFQPVLEGRQAGVGADLAMHGSGVLLFGGGAEFLRPGIEVGARARIREVREIPPLEIGGGGLRGDHV